jgi:hypothetical protein
VINSICVISILKVFAHRANIIFLCVENLF